MTKRVIFEGPDLQVFCSRGQLNLTVAKLDAAHFRRHQAWRQPRGSDAQGMRSSLT